MSEYTSDLAALVGSLARQAKAETTAEHPSAEELLDYQLDALEPTAEDEVRRHLVSCKACADQLLELASLATPEPPSERTADFSHEASWRDLRRRIKGRGGFEVVGRWRWIAAAAAVYLVLPIGLGLDNLRARRQLAGLESDLAGANERVAELEEPFFPDPVPLRRSPMRSETKPIVLPADPRPKLIIPLTEPYFEEYEIQFSSTDGELLWTGRASANEDGQLTLQLSPGFLSQKLWMRLHGLEDGLPHALWKRRIQVADEP